MIVDLVQLFHMGEQALLAVAFEPLRAVALRALFTGPHPVLEVGEADSRYIPDSPAGRHFRVIGL
ncbi:hypothetical protein [Saccharopolyspora spinosa]|uniref:hypothetical protein n=1 Tax=Saccharopolyspora spinosa TaxID=60894 RepID=UPI000237A25B|nr:hypothetical protein [Saccharopolyspora spinosa]